jgi:preprotein translocase subunit Sec61beta
MADNKIRLPSSGGGLMSYSENTKSKITFGPWVVAGLIIVAIVVLTLLYKLGQ